MNWIFIVLLSISAFSAIQCLNEKTIGELKATLEPLRPNLASALAGYKKHNYKVFQRALAEFKPISDVVGHLSDNVTYESDKNAHFAFFELTLYQFVYPVLSDPLKLSDALKVSALAVLLKQENTTISSPEVVDLQQSIREIIEQEKNNDFNKANLELDELYYDLHDVDKEYLPLTSGFVDYAMNTLEEFCSGKSTQEIITKCGLNLVKSIERQKANLAALHKLLPVDGPEKVEKLTEVIQEYLKVDKLLESYSLVKRIQCYGVRCEQRPETEIELLRNVQSTLPELLRVVSPYKQLLEKAISDYKHHQYHTFAKVALQYVFSQDLKLRIGQLPENSTIDDSPVAKETFMQLTIYKYLYPILSDPKQLSDALKVNALINGIIKKDNDSSSALNETMETIKQIIVEENKIHHDFTKVNLVLDDLYDDLGSPKPEIFVFTYGITNQMLNVIGAFCREADHCSAELKNAVREFQFWNEVLRKQYPLNTEKKVIQTEKIIEQFWKFRNLSEKLSNEENIDCDIFKCYKRTKTSIEQSKFD